MELEEVVHEGQGVSEQGDGAFVFIFFSSLLGFGHCNYDNFEIFFNAQDFPLMMNFALFLYTLCVCHVCCLYLCNALYLWLYE